MEFRQLVKYSPALKGTDNKNPVFNFIKPLTFQTLISLHLSKNFFLTYAHFQGKESSLL